MIKFTDNKSEIISLWHEAFGDSEEEITYFLDNVKHAKCLAYCIDGKIASMMFLVNCNLYVYDALYIYAACTLKEYQGRGLMTELIDYCIKNYSDKQLICLIPANDGLVKYYSDRGIKYKAAIDFIAFDESDEICEYLLEGYKLTDPKALYYKEENENGLLVFG